jgi:hypothetical protein
LNSNRIMAEQAPQILPWTSGAAFLVLKDLGRLRKCDGVLSQRERDMATVKTHPAQVSSETEAFRSLESHQRAVYRRLKASYSPTYLTILSVVQAVAMGDLAQVVAAGYHHFIIVQWVLTVNTFGVLIIIWNVFSVQSALWRWIPDVRDSAVPFVVGALELFLNHTITVSLSAWLVAVSLIAVAGALGTLHISWRAAREKEHRELLDRLSVHIRLYVGYLMAEGSVLLALAWACSTDHVSVKAGPEYTSGMLALAIALFSALALGGSVYLFHRLWCEAILYARVEQEFRRTTTAKGRHALRRSQERHPRPARRSRRGVCK